MRPVSWLVAHALSYSCLTITIPIGIIGVVDNRSLILSCALELFAARGYDAVGVQEIAEAAGVTKPTLYHYYGSKQGLLRALISTYLDPFTQAIQEACDYQGNLTLTLRRIAETYFRFAEANPTFYRMQLAMYFAPQDSDAYQMVASRNEAQQQMVETVFIKTVHENGNMRGRHRLYTASFIGTLNTCIGLWLQGYAELDDELTHRVLHQFEHGIYS